MKWTANANRSDRVREYNISLCQHNDGSDDMTDDSEWSEPTKHQQKKNAENL